MTRAAREVHSMQYVHDFSTVYSISLYDAASLAVALAYVYLRRQMPVSSTM
jgi:hypothetical protein